MRSGKEHARPTQPSVQGEGPTASGSGTRSDTAQQVISASSNTQPTGQDANGSSVPNTGSESGSGIYQDVLVDCNALVEVGCDTGTGDYHSITVTGVTGTGTGSKI